jgi:nitrate/nitrite transport system permease protein
VTKVEVETTTPVAPDTSGAGVEEGIVRPPPSEGDRQAPPPAGRPPRLVRMAAAAGWSLLGFAVVVAVWQVFAPEQLATPGDVFERLRSDISDPMYDHGPNDKGIAILLWSSLQRVATGFAMAAVVGVPLGLLVGTSRRWWQSVNPVVQLFRPVSPLAWFPLWMVVFQDGERSGVWVIFITTLWPIVLNTAAGAAMVPHDQRNVARVFRFGRVAYLRHVLVPNALPQIATGLRTAFGLGWLVIVAVEMLGTVLGIGNDTWVAYNGRNYDQMMANIVWIGTLGLIVDALFLRLVKSLTIEDVKA